MVECADNLVKGCHNVELFLALMDILIVAFHANQQVVHLVHPDAERVLMVKEDGAVFRPVSIDVCGFVEPVALLKGPLIQHVMV